MKMIACSAKELINKLNIHLDLIKGASSLLSALLQLFQWLHFCDHTTPFLCQFALWKDWNHWYICTKSCLHVFVEYQRSIEEFLNHIGSSRSLREEVESLVMLMISLGKYQLLLKNKQLASRIVGRFESKTDTAASWKWSMQNDEWQNMHEKKRMCFLVVFGIDTWHPFTAVQDACSLPRAKTCS